MKILFWNTHNNPNINSTLSDLIVENSISMVVLAEYKDDMKKLLSDLSTKDIHMKKQPTFTCERIIVISSCKNIVSGRQTKYATFQIINNKDIFCCIHLPSQIYSDHQGRRNIAISKIVNDIESTELEYKTQNTIIVGDFNENPYDDGCLSAERFHGIPTYKETERKQRTVSGEKFSMFYNPMWNLLGDFNSPPGTYYYDSGNSRMTYWNMFDQVLIRPELRKRFVDTSLQIITTTQKDSLIDKGGHPKNEISDHLPIVFEIKEDTYA